MMKPTVFLAHDSHDTDALVRLKDLLRTKTGDGVEFFLSGHDDSIAPGERWFEEIESALERTELLLVFVSPHSKRSEWVGYEVGVVRGRKRPFIPIGLRGLDTRKLAPPIGVSQGINLDSARGLHRILDAVNRECGTRYAGHFTDLDYVLLGIDRPGGSPLRDEVPLRVVRREQHGERRCEQLLLSLRGGRIVVRSEEWESTGEIEDGLFRGRFRYYRGQRPSDFGWHAMLWSGREFIGRCRFDNGDWERDELIWRLDV